MLLRRSCNDHSFTEISHHFCYCCWEDPYSQQLHFQKWFTEFVQKWWEYKSNTIWLFPSQSFRIAKFLIPFLQWVQNVWYIPLILCLEHYTAHIPNFFGGNYVVKLRQQTQFCIILPSWHCSFWVSRAMSQHFWHIY